MCDVEKLDMGLTCSSLDEDVGIGYKKDTVWVCKACFNKIAEQPWPWDIIEEKV